MTDSKSSGPKLSGQRVGKVLRDQVLLKVGEQLFQSEAVRQAVKNEVLRSVGQAASQVVGSKAAAGNKAAQSAGSKSPSGDLVSAVSEVWQHPVVQGAVKGGLKNASERARTWREQARQRVDARQDEQLERRAQRGESLSPEEVVQLAQRRTKREQQSRQQAGRLRLLAAAQNASQQQVLELLAAHTPWLGGQATPLRYTQLLDTLVADGSAEREMAYHRALWSLAENRVLAVSPYGAITALAPDEGADESIDGSEAQTS